MIGGEFQAAIYSALAGASVADGRIYDQVPAGAVFPYVTIGDEQVLDNGTTCQNGWEVYADVHCWSRPATGSKVEVKTLAAAVVSAVKGISSIVGFSLVSIEHQTTRVLRGSDGLTEHAVVTFRALIDAA